MKKILPLTFFLFIFTYIASGDILLNPIGKIVMHDSFSGELYPFLYSSKETVLDNRTTLKLLDEYDFDNCFFGDVLKVEVVEGEHAGLTGYVLEDEVCINMLSIKNGAEMFFKDNTFIDIYGLKIPKDSKCRIIDTRIENGREILTLQFESPPLKSTLIEYSMKNRLHFIINKKTEILYYIRNGFTAFKIINTGTLASVAGAKYNDQATDIDGFMYLGKSTKNRIIKKKGYTDCIINSKPGMNLYFMQKLNLINYYDDRTSVYEKDFYRFEIKSGNRGVKDKIGIKILKTDDLSVFCYPAFDYPDSEIAGGFFVDKPDESIEMSARINIERDGLELFYYDPASGAWTLQDMSRTGGHYSFRIVRNGFYILSTNVKNDGNAGRLNIKGFGDSSTSTIYFRNKNGNRYARVDSPGITLNADIYEYFYYDIDNPFKIRTNVLEIYDGDNQLDLTKENDGQLDAVKDAERELLQKNFIAEFKGGWQRYAFKKDNKILKCPPDELECLGDMKLIAPDKIIFKTDNCLIEGTFEILDGKKMNINISRVSRLLKSTADGTFHEVNPSNFRSALVIPCMYSFYQGIFQISFNGIYFIRRNILKTGTSDFMTIDSQIFMLPEFPADIDHAEYKIYFSYLD